MFGSSKSPFRLSACLAASVCAFPTFVSVAVAAPYSPDATTPGEAAVAGALDAIENPSGGLYDAITDSIDNLATSGERADALGQLSVRNYRLLPRLAIQSLDATDRAIRGYLVQRREAALDASASVPAIGDRTFNFMLSYGLKQGKYKARTDRPSANSDGRSIMAAADISPARGLIVGTTIGIDGIDANLDRSQRPRSTLFSVNVGGYASYTNGRYYVDATGSYARTEYKVRRQVGWTGFSDQLTSRPQGDNASGTVEAGAILRQGAVRAQPFVGLQYRYADLGGVLEQGGAAALAVAKYKTVSLRTSLGARVTATLGSTKTWSLRPSIEAEWQRELRNRPDSRIEAAFLAGGTPIFTLPSSRVLARDAGIVTAGLTAVHHERTAVRFAYTGEFSSERRVHGFSITLNRRLP